MHLYKPEEQYRPDIDGIRGVAILLVLGFHLFPSLAPGGFIGVDFFFVISGYLISSRIYEDLLHQRFTLSTFYRRRVKRLFPALITVLTVTLAVGWVCFLPGEFRHLGCHTIGATTFISNLLLWRETGYFATAAELTPLLHLWSLGIEEQFYILFPISLWLLHKMQMPKTVCLGIALILSLIACHYGASYRPIANFYLPVTRFWEFLVGCILASLEHTSKQHPHSKSFLACCCTTEDTGTHVRSAVSALGTIMVIAPAIVLTSSNAYPNAWTLLPVVGTAFMISSGMTSPLNRRILANPALVYVGLISYPLYLWHWPLLSIARIVSPHTLTYNATLTLTVVCAVLAWATYTYVETPIRHGSLQSLGTMLNLCGLMVGLFIIGLLTSLTVTVCRLHASHLVTQIETAQKDLDYPHAENSGRLSSFAKDYDTHTGKGEAATLFIGDSHMQQYWPRIHLLLTRKKENSSRVILITAGGSPSLPNVNRIQPGHACDKFFAFAIEEATKAHISKVVFASFWEKYFIGCFPNGSDSANLYRIDDPDKLPIRIGSDAANKVLSDFGKLIASLVAMRKEVVVILSSPSCTSWNPSRPSIQLRLPFIPTSIVDHNLTIRRNDFEHFIHPIKTALINVVLANGGQVIDPIEFFDQNGLLSGNTANGDFKYRDSNHMRAPFVRDNASFIDSLILAQ